MARVLVKVDVRRRAALLETLQSQHEQRRAYGELSFSFGVDDDARHIGYVSLEWGPFKSARAFVDSSAAKALIGDWPVASIIEVLALRDIGEELREIDAKRGVPDA